MPERGKGLVLVGMPTSGKSTVGRIVAERLGRPFVDTDVLVEQRLGMPVPAYLERHDEASFRAHEAAAVAEACRADGALIAAGGGAVLDPLNRWALWRHGPVAWLDADPQVILARLKADATPRPTFQPYSVERIETVGRERAACYRAADLTIEATSDPASVAAEVIRRLGTTSRTGWRLFDTEVARHHPIGPSSARLVMGVDLDRETLGSALPHGPSSAVVDRRLVRILSTLIEAIGPARCLAIPGGERTKRLRQVERILEWLAEGAAERGGPLLAIGGGTIGDVVGTAAALYARGIPLIQIPTTWLAQADSAIGGKVGVDLHAAKNAAGAFWPPVGMVSDVVALRSLPLRARRDGMAESIKSALIGDPALWTLIESRRAALRRDEAARYAIVERSARLKLAVCARDPFEAGERRTLNLGHTVGHALEIESGYRLSHGSAVALGLRAVATIAAGRGGDQELPERLDALLTTLGYQLRRRFDPARVRDAMRGDKKRVAGRQRWILPMAIGHVIEVDDVTDAELDRALAVIGT